MTIVERWRAWMHARDERLAADDVAAWAEIERRVRSTGGASGIHLRPTPEDLAAIANPDTRPPTDRHPVQPRIGRPADPPREPQAQRWPTPRPAPSTSPTFTDLLARVGSLGEAEISRMTVVTATTIDWCLAVRVALQKAQLELAAARPPAAARRPLHRPVLPAGRRRQHRT